jgi:hypothetical protein
LAESSSPSLRVLLPPHPRALAPSPSPTHPRSLHPVPPTPHHPAITIGTALAAVTSLTSLDIRCAAQRVTGNGRGQGTEGRVGRRRTPRREEGREREGMSESMPGRAHWRCRVKNAREPASSRVTLWLTRRAAFTMCTALLCSSLIRGVFDPSIAPTTL